MRDAAAELHGVAGLALGLDVEIRAPGDELELVPVAPQHHVAGRLHVHEVLAVAREYDPAVIVEGASLLLLVLGLERLRGEGERGDLLGRDVQLVLQEFGVGEQRDLRLDGQLLGEELRLRLLVGADRRQLALEGRAGVGERCERRGLVACRLGDGVRDQADPVPTDLQGVPLPADVGDLEQAEQRDAVRDRQSARGAEPSVADLGEGVHLRLRRELDRLLGAAAPLAPVAELEHRLAALLRVGERGLGQRRPSSGDPELEALEIGRPLGHGDQLGVRVLDRGRGPVLERAVEDHRAGRSAAEHGAVPSVGRKVDHLAHLALDDAPEPPVAHEPRLLAGEGDMHAGADLVGAEGPAVDGEIGERPLEALLPRRAGDRRPEAELLGLADRASALTRRPQLAVAVDDHLRGACAPDEGPVRPLVLVLGGLGRLGDAVAAIAAVPALERDLARRRGQADVRHPRAVLVERLEQRRVLRTDPAGPQADGELLAGREGRRWQVEVVVLAVEDQATPLERLQPDVDRLASRPLPLDDEGRVVEASHRERAVTGGRPDELHAVPVPQPVVAGADPELAVGGLFVGGDHAVEDEPRRRGLALLPHAHLAVDELRPDREGVVVDVADGVEAVVVASPADLDGVPRHQRGRLEGGNDDLAAGALHLGAEAHPLDRPLRRRRGRADELDLVQRVEREQQVPLVAAEDVRRPEARDLGEGAVGRQREAVRRGPLAGRHDEHQPRLRAEELRRRAVVHHALLL